MTESLKLVELEFIKINDPYSSTTTMWYIRMALGGINNSCNSKELVMITGDDVMAHFFGHFDN